MKTSPTPKRLCVQVAALLSLAIFNIACVSSPAPDQMARTTLQTAPADLQLLCAGAAATSAGIDSSKILPVSSRALDAETYLVELDASGRKFNCTVDGAGTVRSVQPA